MNRELSNFIHQQISFIENSHQDVSGNGLFKGKAGAIILYFSLFRYTGNNLWEEKAKLLLDKLSAEIADVQELNYGDGLAGIGWMVEWVKQNGFMDINTDEVLEDIDDTLYKAVLYARDKTISVCDGSLGKAAYFLKRYEGRNKDTHRYKIISHQECLVLLTDEISERLTGESGLLDQLKEGNILPGENLIKIGQAMIFLSKVLFHKINAEVVEKTLYTLIKYTDILFDGHKKESNKSSEVPEPIESRLYLAFAYYMTGYKLEYKVWQEKGQQYFDKILQEATILEQYRIQSIPMLSILYQNTEKKYYLKKLTEMLIAMDHQSLSFSLHNGVGEVLLGTISSLAPEVMGWGEALLYS